MSLFYGIVGNVIAIGLAAKSFVESETRGRIVILVLIGTTFLIPRLFPGRTVSLVAFIARMIVAIGCYFFLRYRGEV
jgi:hypothetical protein